jgi:hypothetical protein
VKEPETQELAPFLDEMSVIESATFYKLTKKVFGNPDRYGFESEDEAAEAFLVYKRRLRSIIVKGETLGAKKEAYLETCLRYLARTIRRDRQRRDFVNEIIQASGDPEPSTCSEPPSPCYVPQGKDEEKEAGSWILQSKTIVGSLSAADKRLLFLSVKCAWEIDDVLAAKIASRLSVPMPWFAMVLHAARLSLEGSAARTKERVERRNAAWFRLRLAESMLKATSFKPEMQRKLECRATACRKNYEQALKDRSGTRLLVSNRTISALLQVPKGTVDSGLYYLKNHACGAREPCGAKETADILGR